LILASILFLALPCFAQNPVHPELSYVEKHCDFNLITHPLGSDDDFGDLGIVVHCLDANGDPVEGIPGSAFSLVQLDGEGVWPVTAAATNVLGRTFLTGEPDVSPTVFHGRVAVAVDVGGGTVLVDNGGAGINLELRTPDLNFDGTVNLMDITLFVQSYLCCEDTEQCLRADYDGDGCVGLPDVAIFQEYIGIGKSAAPGDEPGPRDLATDDDENLFIGCLQLDFDDDDDPATIVSEITITPFTPFNLRFIAADFDALTGVDLEVAIPNSLTVLSGSLMDPFNLEIPGTPQPGYRRVIAAADCITEGPVFIYDLTLLSQTEVHFTTDMFTIGAVSFTDCHYPPREREACVGSPTPCDVSYASQGIPRFITCPNGDLDLTDTITVTMRDQDGDPVPGLPAADFRVSLEDERGSGRGEMFRMTPLANVTDDDGNLPFRFEPRDDCRWEGCFDLLITFAYQGCEISIRKQVRTVNVAPAVTEGSVQADAVVNQFDLDAWNSAYNTADDCYVLHGSYRCPVVTTASYLIATAHEGHYCDPTAVPQLQVRRQVVLHQNEPNPFNPVTELAIDLPSDADQAQLRVYDVQGRLVRTLWQGALPGGPSRFVWNGRDDGGRQVSSGIYLARLHALEQDVSVQMVLLK